MRLSNTAFSKLSSLPNTRVAQTNKPAIGQKTYFGSESSLLQKTQPILHSTIGQSSNLHNHPGGSVSNNYNSTPDWLVPGLIMVVGLSFIFSGKKSEQRRESQITVNPPDVAGRLSKRELERVTWDERQAKRQIEAALKGTYHKVSAAALNAAYVHVMENYSSSKATYGSIIKATIEQYPKFAEKLGADVKDKRAQEDRKNRREHDTVRYLADRGFSPKTSGLNIWQRHALSQKGTIRAQQRYLNSIGRSDLARELTEDSDGTYR